MTRAVYWRTRDGQKIRLRDMTDSHLLNAMRLLQRAHRAVVDDMSMHPPMFNGEMAQFFADQVWDRAMSSTVEDLYPVYADLELEAQRRGLRAT